MFIVNISILKNLFVAIEENDIFKNKFLINEILAKIFLTFILLFLLFI